MKKRLVSIILTVFLVLSMMPFAAFADNAIVCPACGGSVTKQERRLLTAHDDFYKCDKCGKWAWVNKLSSLSLFSVGDQQILDAADSSALINFSFNNGKLIPAEKAPSGIGRKDLPGYADDNGTASIGADGKLNVYIPVTGWAGTRNTTDRKLYAGSGTPSLLYNSANIQGTSFSNSFSNVVVYLTFTAPISGTYHFAPNQKFASYSFLSNNSWYTNNAILLSEYNFGFYAGNKCYLSFAFSGGASSNFIASGTGLVASVTPVETLVNKQTNITINNNTTHGTATSTPTTAPTLLTSTPSTLPSTRRTKL